MSSVEDGSSRRSAAAVAGGRIGEILVERGLIDELELARALELQRMSGRRIGETLVEMGAVSSYDLARVLADRLSLGFVDLVEHPIDRAVAQRVPVELARRYRALPIGVRDGAVLVAMADPGDVFAIDDIRVLTGAVAVALVADPDQIPRAIDQVWSGSDLATVAEDAAAGDVAATDAAEEISGAFATADDAPIVRLANAIIEEAIESRASDVHVEPWAEHLRIRMRVDGVLHDSSNAPLSVHRALVSRLKILAALDITRTRTPQDGRFSVSAGDRHVDVRIATIPTAFGEAAVLRLLDRRDGVMELRSLGFRPSELDRYGAAFRAPQGTIITSGPTGSGKTSTLYATLVEINSPDHSIIAVEDPVEYRIEGVKQMQIDAKSGLTFPTALRSILRSDPDVILVGEIRDAETARIAAEAAITGHLVLSTIHTTSAAAVPLRLIDMGVEPFLVTSALSCVVGQRLARRVCTKCSEPDEPDSSLRDLLSLPDELVASGAVRRGVGCRQCGGSGYRGRVAIYEVMPMTEELCRLIGARATSRELERWAISEGMDTLHMAARAKVAEGLISAEEMVRIVV